MYVVLLSIMLFSQGASCVESIQQATVAVENLLNTAAGRQQLVSIHLCCTDLELE